MCVRSVGYGVLAVLWLIAIGACQKSSPDDPAQIRQTEPVQPKSSPEQIVARLHWLGKKYLQGETNAAFFASIWNLPESAKLEAQTLDKLALAFARFLNGATNAASATNSSTVGLVHALFEDLVREESYFEVRCLTNQPGGEMALAIRLNEDRAGAWAANFPRIVERLGSPAGPTGSHPWQLEFENHSLKIKNRLILERIGTWTLLALDRWSTSGGQPPSGGLLKDLAARILSDQSPFAAAATNFWLEADVDLTRVASALACSRDLPVGLPRLSLTMIGDGLNARTRGEIIFPKPLQLEFEPWNIPTNLVHDPLVSFTAINGIRPLLAALPSWTNLNVGTPPNQAFFWTMEGAAVESYFAAPVPNASNVVNDLGGKLIEAWNPHFAENKLGELQRATNFNGISWKGFPFLDPFLKSVPAGNTTFAFGGLGPELPVAKPPPEELIREVITHTNLVYYDWEMTGPRVLAGIYTSQLLRLMLQKPQLPADSTAMQWLKALSQRLKNCGTEITHGGPNQLSFVRNSSIGFTAAELLLLADWFESPAFPYGLYTILAPEVSPPGVAAGAH